MNKKVFYSLFLLSVLMFSSGFSSASRVKGEELSKAQVLWKTLPLQHQGRIKPFDTFAREVLRTVYGKESYKNRPAVEIILSWLILPDFWNNTELILIEKQEIKKDLGLPVKNKIFKPSELEKNQKLALQFVELESLKQMKKNLDSYFKAIEKLETRMILYTMVKTGFLIRLEPRQQGDVWRALPEMTPPFEEQFRKLISLYIRLLSLSVLAGQPENLQKNEYENLKNSSDLKKNLNIIPESKNLTLPKKEVQTKTSEKALIKTAFSSFEKEMNIFKNLNKQDRNKLNTEVFYNSFKPFQKAWILYLLFLSLFFLISILKKEPLLKWIIPVLFMAFACHSLGMILRSYIMSRPPVSNMYETVVWVPWVSLIAGYIFYLKKTLLPLIAGAFVCWFCLFITSLAPNILDGRLQPLEAVLNSNFWLITHVLTITMSYSFFFLAFILGDMALVSFIINKTKPQLLIEKMYHPIYRSIQWGVGFLAGGTILGGIWADYSWGRFWGWDPKESWALITLLAYLLLLHGRLAGWIKAMGMSIGAVMMFFSVIMAWYGVNFILGSGLHSYGFGSGGVEYVLGFLLLHILLVATVLFKKNYKPYQ